MVVKKEANMGINVIPYILEKGACKFQAGGGGGGAKGGK